MLMGHSVVHTSSIPSTMTPVVVRRRRRPLLLTLFLLLAVTTIVLTMALVLFFPCRTCSAELSLDGDNSERRASASAFNDDQNKTAEKKSKHHFPPRETTLLPANLLQDNLRIGRSCRHDGDRWDCRDCGLTTQRDWVDCTPLQPRNVCFEIPKVEDWDSPYARSHSFYDPTASHHATRQILSHYGISRRYEQIDCDMSGDYCFNLTRCAPGDGPLKVYAHTREHYKSTAFELVSHVARHHPDTIIHVRDPSQACLLVVSCNSYGDFRQLVADDNFGDGQNYFIWEATSCFGFGDYPYDNVNFRKAAVATSTRMDANLRKGYDVAIPRVRGLYVNEFKVNRSLVELVQQQFGVKRRWLLAYKGKTHNLQQVWWHHRWLAYEFWDPNDEEVAVDLVCRGNNGVKEKIEYTSEYDYVELLTNSTFAFCPGGGSTQSYRFAEALGLGAIPVVTAELVPPFSPELDWDGCLVRVSEARIIDLPRLLKVIPFEEVRRRQRRCVALFERTVGWVREQEIMRIDSDRTMFTTAMEVWKWRVQHEFRMREMKKELERDFLLLGEEM